MNAPIRTRTDRDGGHAELAEQMRRRRRREDHSDPRSQDFVARLGIPPDARCVEIGAGLGSMARWMATVLAPHGQVLATEVRPDLVASIARPDIANLRAVRHDVRTQPFPEREFDLVYGRFVLEHIPERDAVLRRLCEHLKPGGWLALEDASFDGGALTGPSDYRSAMLTFAGGKANADYRWADDLPSRMHEIGLRDVFGRTTSDLFRSGSEIARFWASVILQEASGATVSRAIEVLLDGSAWFGGPFVVQCAGRRPPDGSTNESPDPEGRAVRAHI